MNIYTRTLALCFFSLCFTKSFSQEFPKLRIDLDRAYGGNASEYFDKVEYIPLETTKESLFGDITHLIITDSSFVVTDEDTRSVLFFSTSGKFLRKVSKSGTLSASGAIYVAQKNAINIAFENAERTKVVIERYSLAGNFIAKDIAEKNSVNFVQNSIIIDKSNYWLRNKISETDSVSNFYFSQYRNNLKIKSVVPFSNVNRYSLYRLTKEIGGLRLPVVQSENFYFSKPIEHKLYKISTVDGVSEPLFQVIFPAKFGIKNSLLDAHNKKQMDSILSKKWFTEKTILALENIIYDKNKMIFKTKTGGFSYYSSDGSRIARNFLYNFQNNLLVAFEKISPDPSTYFLPYSNPEKISFEGFYFKKDNLYTFISSLKMFAAHDATKEKNPQYPEVLQNYFKTQNRKSNPVIVRMKLKE